MKNTFILIVSLSLIPFFSANAAKTDDYHSILASDAPSSSDHPFTGRYDGSTILLQSQIAFEEHTFPTAPSGNNSKKFPEAITEAGKVTRTVYSFPQGRSVLEIFTNVTSTLKEKGFETVWKCKTNECGKYFNRIIYSRLNPIRGDAYSKDRKIFSNIAMGRPNDFRYILMKRKVGVQYAYAGVYIGINNFGKSSNAYIQKIGHRTTGLIEIVEPKLMEQKMVTVDADSISEELANKGTVSLYGLYFDTGKSELEPSSSEQLSEMAKFLKSNNLSVYIVGHTDIQGSLSGNMTLSKARAHSIVEALKKLGVQTQRLKADGVGPLAPVASNKDETGRAKNRRVEMVLMH